MVIVSKLGVLVSEDNKLDSNEAALLTSPELWALAKRMSSTLRSDLSNDTLRGFFEGANPRLVGDVQGMVNILIIAIANITSSLVWLRTRLLVG